MSRKKPKPTIKINLLGQEWRSVAWAVKHDGHDVIADSICNYIKGIPSVDFIEIAIPEGLVAKVYNACLNNGVGAGAKISQEADRHLQGRKSEKPTKPVDDSVMKEALKNATDAAGEMDSEDGLTCG